MIGSQRMVVPVRNGDDDIKPTGRFTRIDGELYYAIQDYDRLDPFLMSVVSDSDHWMYLSSNGGLTAGRATPTGLYSLTIPKTRSTSATSTPARTPRCGCATLTAMKPFGNRLRNPLPITTVCADIYTRVRWATR
ncbi:MAG: hypothetical protein R3C45_04965 [Phycisphaerales bacterium]